LRGKNFLVTIRRLAAERDELKIVADQSGTPNWARALAMATATLVARGLPYLDERAGLYHFSSTGATTWHGFATAIIGDARPPKVTPITTAEYPTPARRPAYGVLATTRFRDTFGYELPPWRDALAACLASDTGAGGAN
jgi:dTDP-4-dehydrorhamnose reductase